jgi:hypothetical protein
MKLIQPLLVYVLILCLSVSCSEPVQSFAIRRETEDQYKVREARILSRSNRVGKRIGEVISPAAIDEIFIPLVLDHTGGRRFVEQLSDEGVRAFFEKCIFISDNELNSYSLAVGQTAIAIKTKKEEKMYVHFMYGADLGRVIFEDMPPGSFKCEESLYAHNKTRHGKADQADH